MLLLQLAAAADTLIVRQVPPLRSGFEQLVFVLSGVTSVLAVILMAVTIWLILTLRARAEETRARVDALLLELRPLIDKAAATLDETRTVAKNANEIVERSRDTIRFADTRVRRAVTTLTDRVDDVSALIGRVNDAASRVETVATTTVAGIKFGARALGLSKRKKRKASKAKATGRPRLRRQD
jgi:hypothetical protein